MKSFWFVESEGKLLASFSPGKSRWADKADDAMRFANQFAAALVASTLLKGKGCPVEKAVA